MKLPPMDDHRGALRFAIERWRAAGLIDQEAATAILAYEDARVPDHGPSRPYLFYALGGLGALAIAIGLLSIVAANWDDIPHQVKLVADLALLLGLGAGLLATGSGSDLSPVRRWAREVLLFIYYGATLASIALVAQIYHLGGEVRHALLLWSAVTFPLCTYGQSRFFGGTWLVALLVTWFMNLEPWVNSATSSDHNRVVLWGTAVGLTSLGLLAVGVAAPLRRVRPQLAAVATSFGGLIWVWLASGATLAWYGSTLRHPTAAPALWPCFLVTVAASAALAGYMTSGRQGAGTTSLGTLLVVAAVAGFAPLMIQHDEVPLVAALHFLVLWSLIGWAALRWQLYPLFNTATAIIGLRLLIIYFEVFKNLLSTGLGLMTGGVLALLGAWVWMRQTQKMRRRVKEAQP